MNSRVPNTIIRIATTGDFDALAAMMRDFYSDTRGHTETDADATQQAADFLNPANGFTVFLAYRENGPVAFAVARERSPLSEGHIYNLYVDAACRYQGMGRALLLRCEDWMKEQSLAFAGLGVSADNETAKSLYLGLGYRKIFNRVSDTLGDARSENPTLTVRRAKAQDWPLYRDLKGGPGFIGLMTMAEPCSVKEEDLKYADSHPENPTEYLLIESGGKTVGVAGFVCWSNGGSFDLGVDGSHPAVRSLLDRGRASDFLNAVSGYYAAQGCRRDFYSGYYEENEKLFAAGKPPSYGFMMQKPLSPG